MRQFVGAGLLAALLACGRPVTPTPSGDAIQRIVQMVPGAGVTVGGVLFRPQIPTGELRPAMVIAHGGLAAGTVGSATVEIVAERFADRGYLGLAISLRGWPETGGIDDCGLSQPDDLVEVVKWLRQQPGVDPGRVGLMGFSLGGQIVLLAAAHGASVNAVVAYYPVTDIARRKVTTTDADIGTYITNKCEPAPGVVPRSPLFQAPSIKAAVLFVHGDLDTRVPVEQSLLMADALRALGRDVEVLVLPGAGHGFPAFSSATTATVDAFLTARLGRVGALQALHGLVVRRP